MFANRLGKKMPGHSGNRTSFDETAIGDHAPISKLCTSHLREAVILAKVPNRQIRLK